MAFDPPPPVEIPTVTIRVQIPYVDANKDSFTWSQIIGPGLVGQSSAFTVATYDLPNSSPRTPRDNPLVEVTSDGNITVRGQVNLKFSFSQNSPDVPSLPAFYPVGISFYCVDEAGTPQAVNRSGSLPRNLVSMGADSNGTPFIQIQDAFSVAGGNGTTRDFKWEYYIIIQDNFGHLGVIDPDIENDTEN